MTEFRRRKDTGRVFPIKNAPAASTMNDLQKQDKQRPRSMMEKQQDATDKLREKGLTVRHNLPIKASDGEIKKDLTIIGDSKHKQEAKEILKDESKMVKEIRDLQEKRKHRDLTGKQADNLIADMVNLDTVDPELHERVFPKIIPDEMTPKKAEQILKMK